MANVILGSISLVGRQFISNFLKSDYPLLLLIMGVAFYLVFIPHSSYPYLVHLDEWIHLACSKQILIQGTTIDLIDPYYGGVSIFNQSVEIGFHLFWAVFHQISGLPWLDIFRYFPGIIFLITVLSVYILAKRKGFGLEAAFFTTLIPTTVGILGPGFLVPAAMGLLFLPLCLFVVFYFRNWYSSLVLLIFIFFLVSMHSVTAVILIIILIPYIVFSLKGNIGHSLRIVLALAIPFLVAFLYSPLMLKDFVSSSIAQVLSPQYLSPFVELPEIIPTYGYIPIVLCILGSWILMLRGGRIEYGLIVGLLMLLLILATFFTLHYGNTYVYYRGLLYSMLMMSVVAGAGLMGVRRFKLPSKLVSYLKAPVITRNVGTILCMILICVTLSIAIPAHQNTPYYHMIDNEDYQAFVWIKNNIDDSYEQAILDPWKGAAFTALTGKKVFSWIGVSPSPRDQQAYEFLADGSIDTYFLRVNRISIVYTKQEIDNPDLVEVRENVYLLKETS